MRYLDAARSHSLAEAFLAGLGLDLGQGDLEELAAVAEPPERYWQERSALSWS